MGSGKSTVASLLKARTHIKWIDLDQFIESKLQLSVPEIFETKGEIFFRKVEHQSLKEILVQNNSFILSLGGGTPCYANNHELLKAYGFDWVYLKASPDSIFERLQKDIADRPLLSGKTKDELKSFIAQHLFERSFFYNQAKYKVTTDGKSPEEIASEIEKLLA